MKKLLRIMFVSSLLMIFMTVHAEAKVFDETTTTTAAQFQYEDYYTIIQRYEGASGVTIESYSPKWKSVDQLRQVEQELLRNKHGEEFELLEKIVIYPDYPAGVDVVGQYYAQYQWGTEWKLLPERKIELYGGDDFTTIGDIAHTLSHEYGHHFSFYHLIEGENEKPANWKNSSYAEARQLSKNSNAHSDGVGEYIWSLAEIFAEDYVQLFGSELAIKNHAQMNGLIDTPFDQISAQQYWVDRLDESEYNVREPIQLDLLNYEENTFDSAYYNMEMLVSSQGEQNIYLIGQDGNGEYIPVTVDEIRNDSQLPTWYDPFELEPEQSWIFDSYTFDEVKFFARQHEQQGFNRGSATLYITYNNIEESRTTPEQLNIQKVLSTAKIKELLTESATKHGIPPEILKAMAYVDTGMKQFDDEGNPLVGEEGGIGLMQVVLSEDEMMAKGIDRSKLETDTQYNIDIAAQLLKEKWESANIPTINDHVPAVIEHWYFALMAYNGLSQQNDPSIKHQQAPYQERVFDVIRQNSLVNVQDIPSFEVEYENPAEPDELSFLAQHYEWEGLETKSRQLYEVYDFVYTYEDNLTNTAIFDEVDGEAIAELTNYFPLQIIEGPFENSDPSDHTTYYAVYGNIIYGYVSSSHIKQGEVSVYPDIFDMEIASAVGHLQLNNIINGYTDGTYKPDESLLRRHAAAIFVRALGLTLPEGYEMQATDMEQGDIGYEDMAIAEAHGLMGIGGALRPNELLTRSQIASMLVRAYHELYIPATDKMPFADIDEAYWNYEDINLLAFNGIINEPTFRPTDFVTRAEFALLLSRTLLIEEK
ncbi:S-layer homology domain-containing protein [Cytobacillus sp. IB215665]|uniref:S-layer homology domain-containing protein n=1 Tax=Cytobacillus sp. IB215665 TaxID=3097357 RepID=UPI002A13EF38|nr:S-layer homology domain-containing protein [Cytobacillus sp. IB215665]MDX8363769.1 S-layer homology domain-containing protein [Cytobacillus sp. IB215665]